jgi:hypothetical protein
MTVRFTRQKNFKCNLCTRTVSTLDGLFCADCLQLQLMKDYSNLPSQKGSEERGRPRLSDWWTIGGAPEHHGHGDMEQ